MASSSRSSTLTPCNSPSPEPPIVQPDHFYGSEGIQLPPSPNSDGKTWLDPEDDPAASRGIPVFKPSMEEFQDFEAYMEKVNCWGMKSGIVKVIPPKEWTSTLPDIKPQLQDVKIRSPIEQVMLGSGGLFRQQNMEKRRIMSVREWAELCGKDEYRAPVKQEIGLESRGARVAAPPRTRRVRKKESVAPDAVTVIKEEPEDDTSLMGSVGPSVPSPPASDAGGPSRASTRKSNKSPKQEPKDEPKAKAKRVHQSREARQASLADRAVKDSQFLDTFEPRTDWLPDNMTPEDYTPEFCQKLERHYWRNCSLGKSAWYGADTQGTLFTDETKSWNVGHLPSALSRLLPTSNAGLPGVNTPYLYFGMWRATFAWHVEDMDLYSINYIHFGAPKFWYAVPQTKSTALEHAMRTYFPSDTSQCPQFLRHKSFLVSPMTLAKSSCRPNHLVQHAGEFVITYPRGYHAGFNLGFNCAESVNFALECWIEMGRVAQACKCVSDSVRIDVDQLLHDRAEECIQAIEAEVAAEAAAAEALMETEGSPKKLSKSKRRKSSTNTELTPTMKQEASEGYIPPLKIPLKRKAEEKEEQPKLKKIRLKPSPSKSHASPHKSSSNSNSFLSFPTSHSAPILPKLKLKLGPKPVEAEQFPCCLCVSMDKVGLLPVNSPPQGRKDAVEAAGHPRIWMAHEQCASIIPETWVDEAPLQDGTRVKAVFGVDAIVKDRWNLKCSACSKTRSKGHGAPVQCTRGKCPKAFHVSCAREGHPLGIVFSVTREVEKEVVIETHQAFASIHPMQMELDGQSQKELEVLKVVKKLVCDVLCPQHNPALAAQKKASKQEKIKSDLLALPTLSRIKIRVSSGVFEVSLIRVIEENASVEVVWDRDVKREFKWGSVVFGSTDGPVQQRPAEACTPRNDHDRSVSAAVSNISLPVQTYPSLTAATFGDAHVPTPNVTRPPSAQAAQPATTSHYKTPGSRNPYWAYPTQQVPYASAQTPYTYVYSAYYPASAYPAASTSQGYQTYPSPQMYPASQQDPRYQWRPYEGPISANSNSSNHSTTTQTNISQGQLSGGTVAIPFGSQPHLESSDASSGHLTKSVSDGATSSGVMHVPPAGSVNGTAPLQPQVQQGYPDLTTLARLPHQELTEVLRLNPQLRDYVMAAIHQSNTLPQPSASHVSA
ncbi:JmjC-domain-containing protein [Coprinopsis marcescibilis]|uniref:[histone H3]-trimethyl-L-lysine(9) demethylase n=1 Tax=Coprinopsis marcescibilis TaxID=230819 RepID=A0A5C3KYW3_COPMA|nr:JmjC-domain-containing protein [Coprinopsis marcescibilis]